VRLSREKIDLQQGISAGAPERPERGVHLAPPFSRSAKKFRPVLPGILPEPGPFIHCVRCPPSDDGVIKFSDLSEAQQL
jgi:hypothetical protein